LAGLGRKEFNSGDILLASEVQGYLQDQAVMVFDDDAARGSAIPTPSEGMVTYTKDDDAIQVYDGSNFVGVGSDSGLIHIKTENFSAVSSVALDNVFSSDFSFYTIFIDSSPSTSLLHSIRLRVGGTPASGANYNIQRLLASTGAVGNTATTGATSAFVGFTDSANMLAQINMAYVFDTVGSRWQVQSLMALETAINGWFHTLTNSYDGFELNASTGNITGTITVCGVKK
jgi:hypothetical protein